MRNKYYFKVSDGLVFEGNVEEFKNKFYSFPDDLTEEEVLNEITDWASQNKWSMEIHQCH